MNIIINNKADVYNSLPIDIQSKIDNIIRLNTTVYFIHHVGPLIQKKRFQCHAILCHAILCHTILSHDSIHIFS